MPASGILKEQFKGLIHTLSPLPQFHFRIIVLNTWKVLDIHAVKDPEGTQPEAVAVFRAPGAWMTDPNASAREEITVSVLNDSGSALGADSGASILRSKTYQVLSNTLKTYTILQERTVPSPVAFDLLMKYKGPQEPILGRIRAVFSKDRKRIFLITATAPEKDYNSFATALYVGTDSFVPEK